jgi:hypothetical protein
MPVVRRDTQLAYSAPLFVHIGILFCFDKSVPARSIFMILIGSVTTLHPLRNAPCLPSQKGVAARAADSEREDIFREIRAR